MNGRKKNGILSLNRTNLKQKALPVDNGFRNSGIGFKEPLHPLIREMIRKNPSYYPQAVFLVSPDGIINEIALQDIAYFYGMSQQQVKMIREKLLQSDIRNSEKLLFRQRVHCGLYQFSPLIWAQKHKIKSKVNFRIYFVLFDNVRRRVTSTQISLYRVPLFTD